MTFREDHDAAIARADALENELEDEREKAELAQVQLEAERAERKRLEGLVEKYARGRRLEAAPKVAEPRVDWNSQAKPKEPQPFDPVGTGMWALFGVAILLFVIAVVKYS